MKKAIFHIEMINRATEKATEYRVAADDFASAYTAATMKAAELGGLCITKIEQTETVAVV